MNNSSPPRVALFITCLINTCRPSVAFAALHLLKASNTQVFIPQNQTCCGQIAYNAGDKKTASDIARKTITLFNDFDYIVVPSGSCAAMLSQHYPLLLKNSHKFSQKCFELTDFLVNIQKFHLSYNPSSSLQEDIVYHDSCSGLRELSIHDQPRKLLSPALGQQKLHTPNDDDRCCGFGGSFCVTCSDVSAKMADDKIQALAETNAQHLVGGDLGCLIHLAGRMRRQNYNIRVDHIAEVLSQTLDNNQNGVSSKGIA